MPVIPSSFGPIADRSAEIDAVKGVHVYRQTFFLRTDDQNDGQDVVLAFPLLPQNGDVHPSFPAAWVQKRRARQPDKAHHTAWNVDIEWSSAKQDLGQADNPLHRPLKVSWRSETYQEYVSNANVFDLNGNLLEQGLVMMSSAREAFDPTNPDVNRDQSRLVATVVGNVPYAPVWLLDYQDAVNNDHFTLDGLPLAPFQAKVTGSPTISDKQTENGVTFRVLTMQIHCRREGFRRKVADRGFRESYLDDAGKLNQCNIYDSQGQPVSKPWPIDGRGHKVDPDWGLPEVFFMWQVYEELSFSYLGLPT